MTLLSGTQDIYSHSCRIVLHEKDVECAIEYVSIPEDSERIKEHNPYTEIPTLIDRDISLYGMWVIVEFLDERFPHPPLMPVDPVIRAKTRLMVSRLSRDWFDPLLELSDKKQSGLPTELRKDIVDGLVSLSSVISGQKYFLGDDFSLVDAYMAPLLWRLPSLGIEYPDQLTSLHNYEKTLHQRPSFLESLTEAERDLRE